MAEVKPFVRLRAGRHDPCRTGRLRPTGAAPPPDAALVGRVPRRPPAARRRRRAIAMDTIGFGDSSSCAGGRLDRGLGGGRGQPPRRARDRARGRRRATTQARYIAIEVAAARPDRVARSCSPARHPLETRPTTPTRRWSTTRAPSSTARTWSSSGASAPFYPKVRPPRAVHRRLPAGGRPRGRGARAVARYPLEERLPMITAPC